MKKDAYQSAILLLLQDGGIPYLGGPMGPLNVKEVKHANPKKTSELNKPFALR
jgi:hypothetical protein